MSSRLGIIGGIGSAAGVNLAQRVVRLAQIRGATKDSDFPDFMLYNLPARGMDEFGFTDEAQVFDQLLTACMTLAAANCAVLVIACNTVQVFHERLREQLNKVILVNSVEAACDRVMDYERVGVICSQTSKKMGLFDAVLAHRNIKMINTNAPEQACVDETIAAAISGKQDHRHNDWLVNIMGLMAGRGAQKIILGCTELPLVMTGNEYLDTVDAGAAAIDKALTLL